MTFWPSTLPPDPLFDAITARVLAAAADRTDKEWKGMSDKPSGVAAAQAAATDIGRLPLAAVLRSIAPGYSTCKRCKMPWAFTQGHCTKWNDRNGMFPLCQHCWERLSPSERLPYYRMLWQEWHEWGAVCDPAWHEVETAVMAGL